jgi:hypothetical protein
MGRKLRRRVIALCGVALAVDWTGGASGVAQGRTVTFERDIEP